MSNYQPVYPKGDPSDSEVAPIVNVFDDLIDYLSDSSDVTTLDYR